MSISALRANEPAGRQTLAETLRLQLADEIVRGALQPGTALDETELARRFAMSRTPVREIERINPTGERAPRNALISSWP